MFGRYRVLTMIALLAGFAAPAFAAGESGGIGEGFTMLFPQNGQMVEKVISDKALLDEIAKTGIELPAGTMVAVHNGKAYLVRDVQGTGGKLMSDRILH